MDSDSLEATQVRTLCLRRVMLKHTIFAVKVHGVVVHTSNCNFGTVDTTGSKLPLTLVVSKSKVTKTECETWSSLYESSASARADRDDGE